MTKEHELLESIDGKLDTLADNLKAMDAKIDHIQQKAVISGAVAGGMAGGIVALSISFIRSKLGF